MDKPLYVFEPIKHAVDPWLATSLGFFLVTAAAYAWIQKRSRLDYNRKNALLMSVGFVALIALGVSGFKIYSLWRIQPVSYYSNYLETPFGRTSWSNVKDYFIRTERHYKPMQPDAPQDSIRFFIVIERDDKTHLMSEGDYPIDSMLAKMNDLMGY